jgi:hypothetical protein
LFRLLQEELSNTKKTKHASNLNQLPIVGRLTAEQKVTTNNIIPNSIKET